MAEYSQPSALPGAGAEQEQPKKRRKWDVGGDAAAPVPSAGVEAAQAAAAAFANAASSLGLVNRPAATGPAQPSAMSKEALERARQVAVSLAAQMTQGAKGAPPVTAAAPQQPLPMEREVMINDAPAAIRNHLLKKSTQTEVENKTGTVIVTRGRFYAPGQTRDPKAPPLHLYIRPSSAPGQSDTTKTNAINAAVTELHLLLGYPPGHTPANNGSTPPPSAAAPPYPGAAPLPGPPSAAPYYSASTAPPNGAPQPMVFPQQQPPPQPQHSLVVYLNIVNPPHVFNLPEKIRGPASAYLNHIQTTTGSAVVLRGKGSVYMEGPDPLHVFVQAPSAKQVEDAKTLVMDLIKTVKDDLIRAYPHMATCVAPTSVVDTSTPAPTPQATPAPAPAPAHGAAPAAQPYAAPPGAHLPAVQPHAVPGQAPPYVPPYPGYPPPHQAYPPAPFPGGHPAYPPYPAPGQSPYPHHPPHPYMPPAQHPHPTTAMAPQYPGMPPHAHPPPAMLSGQPYPPQGLPPGHYPPMANSQPPTAQGQPPPPHGYGSWYGYPPHAGHYGPGQAPPQLPQQPNYPSAGQPTAYPPNLTAQPPSNPLTSSQASEPQPPPQSQVSSETSTPATSGPPTTSTAPTTTNPTTQQLPYYMNPQYAASGLPPPPAGLPQYLAPQPTQPTQQPNSSAQPPQQPNSTQANTQPSQQTTTAGHPTSSSSSSSIAASVSTSGTSDPQAPRRRFREFVEKPTTPQATGYLATYANAYGSNNQQNSTNQQPTNNRNGGGRESSPQLVETSSNDRDRALMPPPPPRRLGGDQGGGGAGGLMNPPPPRPPGGGIGSGGTGLMGPPPPRPPALTSGVQAMTPLPGLSEYADDDDE